MAFMDGLFARLYPAIIKGSEKKWLRVARAELLMQAAGDVVEIGAGTGLNLEHYGPEVRSLTVTEASEYMLPALREAVRKHRPDARVVHAPAESLPVPDASADYVISTLVLCTAGLDGTLKEVRRVLRPGGTFLVLEHVRGEGKVAAKQRRAEPFTKFFGRGCHVTRDVRAALEGAGFDTAGVADHWVDSEPKIYAPHVQGAARLREAQAPRG